RRDGTPRCRRRVGTVITGDGRQPGSDVGMSDFGDPHRVQRPKVWTVDEVELANTERHRPQFALLGREVGVDNLAEGALGRDALRHLLVLRVLAERDPSKELARALPGLPRGEPGGGAEGDAPRASAGPVLADKGAALSLQAQSEAGELAVPGEELTLPLAQ